MDTVLPGLEKVLNIVTKTAEDQKEIARLTAALLKFTEIRDLPKRSRPSGDS